MSTKLKIQIQLWALRILIYLLFVGSLLYFSWLIDKIIEFVIIIVSYTCLRWKFPKTWHSKKILNCFIYSIVFFCVLDACSIPIYISLFGSIISSLLFTCGLYHLQNYLDLLEEKSKVAKKTIFDLTKEELYTLMDNSTLKSEEKDVIEYRVIYHYKGKKLYDYCGYSKRQVQNLYNSAVKKLNKLIK